MKLTPQELDKLTLHQVGGLAQKRLARGVRLNHPEAIALIATQLLELIRDGRSVAELMQLGRTFLGRRNVMSGVPEMIHEVHVEGTFPDGSKLVTVHDPIVALHGDLRLALYGSFLPIPERSLFESEPAEEDQQPGAYLIEPGEIELNAGRVCGTLSVTNTGDRPVQVGSHYPFSEVNRALVFDRVAAIGMRLDIPAGTAVRFEPGDVKRVPIVEIAGRRIVRGGNRLVDGNIDDAETVTAARLRITGGRFGHRSAP